MPAWRYGNSHNCPPLAISTPNAQDKSQTSCNHRRRPLWPRSRKVRKSLACARDISNPIADDRHLCRYLIAENHFSCIHIYEQRSTVGGVWNYTPDERNDGIFNVPQTEVWTGLEKPIWRRRSGRGMNGPFQSPSPPLSDSRSSTSSRSPIPTSTTAEKENVEPVFPSPMYERLETNIPRTLMQFSDLSFPSDGPLFPSHDAVKEYVDEYAQELLPMITFQTQVRDVRLLHSRKDTSLGTLEEKWAVEVQDLKTGDVAEKCYEAVIVANGHYNVPYVPEVKGAAEWNKAYPGAMTHSKFYRKPEEYSGMVIIIRTNTVVFLLIYVQKVILVGNSASGLDIGRQISKFCKPPLLISQRSPSYFGSTASPLVEDVPLIESFTVAGRTVRFVDGRVESDIDVVLFCTGYLYSYPMLSTLTPPPVTDGAKVENTFKHLIYSPHPTLTFIALPQKVIPFPISEAQAAVVARLYSGRLHVPALPTMQRWEKERVEQKGAGRAFHVLSFPEDAEYINDLLDWAAEAGANEKGDFHRTATAATSSSSVGKTRPKWGEREFWTRERFTDIRKAFLAKEEARYGVTSLEMLGFNYDAWVHERNDTNRSKSLGV